MLAGLLAVATGARALDAQQGAGSGFDLGALDLPAGFLTLADLEVSGPRAGVVIATATSTFAGNAADVLVSSFPAPGSGRGAFLAIKPTDFSLTRTFPALANPLLESLTFEYAALVLSTRDLTLTSAELSPDERAFFREVYRQDAFIVTLRAGVNLIAAIPAEGLAPDHPLNVVMDALGIEKGTILIQGALGADPRLLTNPAAAGAALLQGMLLRAELPPMRPPGSPAWFHSGQLALEITGLPSLRLVGEMNVNIEQDRLQFFAAATLARTGMSLSGGLQADSTGWVQPFGIEWLTLHKVVLLLGITPTGSIQLGFAGDAVFGAKDIAVAVAIAISPAGVPTNFMIQGESEAGVALSDLAMVQRQMATAAGEEAPAFPIDALPDVAVKDLGLKFAPKPEPALGIEQGMAIKGRLWLPMSADGELVDFAGVDVNVARDGLWIRGDIGALQLGPLALEDSKLDLTRTRDAQHLIVKGAATLLGARQELDVSMSRAGLAFRSESRLWDLFTAQLDATATFDLRAPAFRVRGLVRNDFADVIGPLVGGGLQAFAEGGGEVIADAQRVTAELDRLLADREADVARIRAALLALRAEAKARLDQREAARRAAAATTATLKRAMDAAWGLHAGTPWNQPALRAQRYGEYLGARTRWQASVVVLNGRIAVATAAQAVLDALPPVDQNLALQGARAALALAQEQLRTARGRLDVLERRFTQLQSAFADGAMPLTVREASFEAELAGLMGNGGAQWRIAGTFLGSPFTVERSLDFSDVAAATAQIVQELLR